MPAGPTMQAALCTRHGEPAEVLKLATLPIPACGADELLVRVAGAGVNFPDLLIVQGRYQEKPPLPFVPGLELSGVIEAVGAGVHGFRKGNHVIATTRPAGAFAEFAAIKAADAHLLPSHIALVEAAAVPVTYGTAYHAFVQRASLRAGEIVLVTGAGGGAGLAAVSVAHQLGGRVIAVASSAEKRAAAREQGAEWTLDPAAGPLADQVKVIAPLGADVAYDAVGGDAFDQALKALAPDGRLLVVGFAAGRIGEVKANRLLLKEISVEGVWWGAFARRRPEDNRANFRHLIAWLTEGRFRPPIWRRYGLSEAAAALDAITARAVIGKALLVPTQF